jgi:hypothetical protein
MLWSMVIGVGVIVLIGGVGLVASGSFAKAAEQRLEGLMGGGRGKQSMEQLANGILLRPTAINTGGGSFWAKLVPNPENLNLLYEQADVNLTFNSFMAMVIGLGWWASSSLCFSSCRSTWCRWGLVSWPLFPSSGC